MANRVFARRLACLLATIAPVGCTMHSPFSPPEGTQRFEPPPAYRIAWQQVEGCSGLRGNFDRVRWFVIPQQPTFDCLGTHWYGPAADTP
jgi:hypothetical protein